jgi:hypothetical protein
MKSMNNGGLVTDYKEVKTNPVSTSEKEASSNRNLSNIQFNLE